MFSSKPWSQPCVFFVRGLCIDLVLLFLLDHQTFCVGVRTHFLCTDREVKKNEAAPRLPARSSETTAEILQYLVLRRRKRYTSTSTWKGATKLRTGSSGGQADLRNDAEPTFLAPARSPGRSI